MFKNFLFLLWALLNWRGNVIQILSKNDISQKLVNLWLLITFKGKIAVKKYFLFNIQKIAVLISWLFFQFLQQFSQGFQLFNLATTGLLTALIMIDSQKC